MAYRLEKNGEQQDIVISGFEKGIAISPLKGIANIQNANIATEQGQAMASYARILNTVTDLSTTGSLTFVDSTHVGLNMTGSNGLFKGTWITVSGSTHAGELPDGNYYVLPSTGGGFQLSSYYNGAIVSGLTSGLTASFTLIRRPKQGVGYAIETYSIGTSTQYRYYVLDSQGLVWVYDTVNEILYSSSDNVNWFLPDTSITYFGSDTAPSGIGVLNGWLMVFSGNKIWVKQTVNLAGTTSTTTLWQQMTNAVLTGKPNTSNPHFAITGHQGRLYYTDGIYIGSIFPNTSLLSGAANVQSYAKYTSVADTGTISPLIAGSIPWTASSAGVVTRIPAVFFTDQAGTQPTNLSTNTVYYIEYSTANDNFKVYAALTGGAAINISTGAAGNQYFNTFWVLGTHAGAYGDTSTCTFSPQRLNLPGFEISKAITEIGNLVIIGGTTNTLYPWNQVDVTPSTTIYLPEANTSYLLTVNQVAYVFAGNKGNIYITDGNVASLVVKVPDYCAGVPGTPSTYYEPVFVWGGAMYLRGRVYFSILDQVSGKAGNCGGIWSFYPTQNLYYGQDTGLALRLENENSYATYSGVATVLIPKVTQTTKSPQYWSAWYSSISSPTYGIDNTDTAPSSSLPIVIETDLIPIGTMLNKATNHEIEYKLASPREAGETVTAFWRTNSTASFTALNNFNEEGTTSLSGYTPVNFEGAQWIQLRFVGTPNSSSTASGLRFTEFRIR